jgi:hypothetical protein
VLGIGAGEWKGIDGLGKSLIAELKPACVRAVRVGAVYLVTQIKLTLTGQRHGRRYLVSGAKRATYTASAPGEPPAVMFGNLRNSIGHGKVAWVGTLLVQCEVGVGLGQAAGLKIDPARTYARRLEFGGVHVQRNTVSFRTATGWATVKAGTVIRILARPYLAPTVERVQSLGMLTFVMQQELDHAGQGL